MWWMIAKALFGGGVSVVQQWLANKQKVADAKAEAQKITVMSEAKIRERLAAGDIDYNIAAQRQMETSWKDEYLTIVLSLPFIGSFIPGVQDYVLRGWGYVAKAPQWYQVAFLGVIVASFGLRGWFKHKYLQKMGD